MNPKEFKIQLALGSLTNNMKIELAKNKNTPTEVLQVLSTDSEWSVRAEVIFNPNTSIGILETLSKDENLHVKEMAERYIGN